MNDNHIGNEVLITLRRIIRAIDLHSKELVRLYGVTVPQLVVLQEVDKNPDTPIGDVAKKISLSNATVTEIITRLEKKGCVTRQRSDCDKRQVIVNLTQAGKTLVQSTPSLLHYRFVREMNKLHDWEQTSLLYALQRISAMIEAKEIEEAPFLFSDPIPNSSDSTN